MDYLIYLIQKLKNPSVVGLDTNLSFIPQYIKKKAVLKFGDTEKAAAIAVTEFNKKIIDALYDIVPAVKIQLAFYEVLGAQGIRAAQETAKYAKEAGMYVIFDGKRNDIASSMNYYSKAYLGHIELLNGKKYSAFNCDSLTVNGYLGSDSINSLLKDCENFKKTIFVLWKTSNPSSKEIQDLSTKSDEKVFEKMAKICTSLGKNSIGEFGYSNIGAVVGATNKKELEKLRNAFPNTFFLVPGFGAQGGCAKDVSVAFKNKVGAIINSSRKIISAWQQTNEKEENFAKAAKLAAQQMKQELNMYI